ncbi:MAG: 50S ribosomal protein L3 [Pirellulales bacterium]
MAKGLLGRKVGMTQVFDESGKAIPVTVIEAGPCHVLQVRTPDRDGYSALQLGFLDKPRRLASRSERGHVADLGGKRAKKRQAAGVSSTKAGCEPKRFVRELRGEFAGAEVGQELTVDALAGVKAVDVVGVTKGRGYAGVIKRHGFGGQRATHGVKKVHRHMGGTGGLAAWRGGGRPKKGKKMPGHYGFDRVTARNLDVVRIDKEKNLLLVRGAVPGPAGAYVVIKETNKVS